MPEHHTLTVRGYPIEFHIYVDVRDSAFKVRALERFFQRLPDAHLAVVYPIFAIELKPGGRRGGGTWPPARVTEFLGKESRTGVPDEDIRQYALNRSRGVIGLSKDRWERSLGRLEYTVFHEVAHCVDFSLGLLRPGATANDFLGIDPTRCGAGSPVVRRAVEAYARYVCNPNRLLNEPLPLSEREANQNPLRTPAGQHAREQAAVQRILEQLRAAPAFRAVPQSWRPQ